MKRDNTSRNSATVGILYAFAAFVLWGFLPIYWKLLEGIPSEEILAHRIFWSALFLISIIIVKGRLKDIKRAVSTTRNILFITACAILITINWGVYIWAVNSGHIVEAGMGYYITPLLVVLLAVVILKEKLGLWKLAAVMFAFIGVLVMTFRFGRVPWIALILALSFSFYGLLKKFIDADSTIGVTLETIILAPAALAYIILKQASGTGALGAVPVGTVIILLMSGVVTATPLLWYSMGAKNAPLSTLGLIQYIAPTIQIIIGVLMYGEQFTDTHLISFGFIWFGLIIYSLAHVGVLGKPQPKVPHIQKE